MKNIVFSYLKFHTVKAGCMANLLVFIEGLPQNQPQNQKLIARLLQLLNQPLLNGYIPPGLLLQLLGCSNYDFQGQLCTYMSEAITSSGDWLLLRREEGPADRWRRGGNGEMLLPVPRSDPGLGLLLPIVTQMMVLIPAVVGPPWWRTAGYCSWTKPWCCAEPPWGGDVELVGIVT